MKLKAIVPFVLSCIFVTTLFANNQSPISQQIFVQSQPQQLQLSPQESSVLYQKLQQIIQLRRLDMPVFSLKDAANFASNALKDLYTFNYGTYEINAKNSRQNFTAESWRAGIRTIFQKL